MASEIRDAALAPSGAMKIAWVKDHCDLLRTLEEEFTKTKPFEGKKVALSVHLEAKTAYLCKVLKAGGAQMYVIDGADHYCHAAAPEEFVCAVKDFLMEE